MMTKVTTEMATLPILKIGSLVAQARGPRQLDGPARADEIRLRVEQEEHRVGLNWSLLPRRQIFQAGSPGGHVAAALVAAHVYLRLAADLRKLSLEPIFGWDDTSNRAWSNPLGLRLQWVALQLDQRREELYPFLCAYEPSPFIEAFLRHFWLPATQVSHRRMRATDCEVLQGALTASLQWAEDAARRKKRKLFYNDARKATASASAYLQSLPSTGELSVVRVELTPQPALPDLYNDIVPMVREFFQSAEVVDQEAQEESLVQHVFKSYSAQLTRFLNLLKRDLKQTLVGYSIKQEFKPGVGAYFNAFLFFDGDRWADFGVLRAVVKQFWSAAGYANPVTADEAAHFAVRWSFPAGRSPDWDDFVGRVLAQQVDGSAYLSLRLPADVRAYRRGTIRGEGRVRPPAKRG